MRFISARYIAALIFGATILASVSPAYAATHTTTASHNTQKQTTASVVKKKVYKVRSGNTLWGIARKYHITVAALRRANPHVKASVLLPGHSLVIPNGASTASHHIAKKPSPKAARTKEITVKATAYTPAQGNIDATGHKVKFGVIAVDPKVIPLGTKVRVTGMSMNGFPSSFTAIAGDTGGAIKGDHIDIFLPVSERRAMDFGVQHVKVYVM